jgi:hypothetical protein
MPCKVASPQVGPIEQAATHTGTAALGIRNETNVLTHLPVCGVRMGF